MAPNVILSAGTKFSRFLDSTRAAASWQKFKWSMKYFLGSERYVAPMDVLVEHPHREAIVHAIRGLAPYQSLLEVGCGRGANLVLLARAEPSAKYVGTDISNKALELAKAELMRRNLGQVELRMAAADNLSSFSDSSVDIILCDATLMYVPPDSIRQVFSEFDRVAKKALVISSWHSKLPKGTPWRYEEGTWIYDFEQLIEPLETRSPRKTSIQKFPPESWSAERWIQYGYLITIEKRDNESNA